MRPTAAANTDVSNRGTSTHSAVPTPDEMRRAMGAFGSGVTVVSGLDGAEPVGFTCQAFASVSLDPPLVLFCADHRGSSWPRIHRAGRFCVNVLAEDQIDLCLRFGSRTGKRYDGLPWTRSQWNTPALHDVLLRVHCSVVDVHITGDHDVVVGRVLEIEIGAERGPLIFFRGRFGVATEQADEVSHSPMLWGWGDPWW